MARRSTPTDASGLPDKPYFKIGEAARLCAVAVGGEILTTDLVRMLARSRSDAELEPVGGLELKGIAEPMEIVSIDWR